MTTQKKFLTIVYIIILLAVAYFAFLVDKNMDARNPGTAVPDESNTGE